MSDSAETNFVTVESPFAGKTPVAMQRNIEYLRAAMADCFARGEVPFASHGIYTAKGVLDDTKPEERKKGMEAGFSVSRRIRGKRVFYADRGFSSGMVEGLKEAAIWNTEGIEVRTLGDFWSVKNDPTCMVDLHSSVFEVVSPNGTRKFHCVACDCDVVPTAYTTYKE